jgi:hypothetical protein
MGKIIIVSFRRSRLPRRLLRDGWWLNTLAPCAVAFPKRDAAKPEPGPKPRVRHLTLVTSRK